MNAISMNLDLTSEPINDLDVLDIEVARVRIPKITVGVFAASEDVRRAIQDTAADRRMDKASFAIHSGGVIEAARHYATHQTANLLIVESRADRETLLRHLDILSKECVSGTKVIVVGHQNDVSIYRDLMEMGVGDYLVAPLDPMTIMRSVNKLFEGADKPKLGRITAFFGARGGVGSSTIAHNVAATLATIEACKPMLIDLDFEFGSAALNFNVEPHMVIADVLSNGDAIDDGLLERASVMSNGLRILGTGMRVNREYDIQPAQIDRLLEVLATNTGHYVIDLPIPRTEIERRVVKAADEVVVTATPDIVSLRNAKNLVEWCKRIRPNDPLPRVVINQVGVPRRPEIPMKAIRSALQLTPISTIPFDASSFGAASNNGQLVSENCKAGTLGAFQKVANVILRGKHHFPHANSRGLFRNFVDKFR